MPAAVFTYPEAGSVGLSEDACKKEGIHYTVKKGFYRSNGKALAMEETEGMVKVMADENGKILGCHFEGIGSRFAHCQRYAIDCNRAFIYRKVASLCHFYIVLVLKGEIGTAICIFHGNATSSLIYVSLNDMTV